MQSTLRGLRASPAWRQLALSYSVVGLGLTHASDKTGRRETAGFFARVFPRAQEQMGEKPMLRAGAEARHCALVVRPGRPGFLRQAGIRSRLFHVAIKGLGGCPMASRAASMTEPDARPQTTIFTRNLQLN
ncbi:hypothetical protein [Xanthomonas bromi]|uniref:hypothetical protein n=1 Tax=Xanthomonas bromi TaxID=56449 RepID=UPI001111F558|nr:hypothetical protein [Xanthomonas bromi]